jgi:hypothetical protein
MVSLSKVGQSIVSKAEERTSMDGGNREAMFGRDTELRDENLDVWSKGDARPFPSLSLALENVLGSH